MMKRLAALVPITLAALILLACGRKGDTLAWLEQKQGTVDRDFADRVGTWVGAEPKTKFVVGDGIRTGADATARLELSDKSKLSLEPKTLVRFQLAPRELPPSAWTWSPARPRSKWAVRHSVSTP